MLQEIFNQHREVVVASFPSIFTKEDVLRLLDEVEASIGEPKPVATPGVTYDQREELEDLLRQGIERKLDRMDSSDAIDYDSAEFSIEYNNTLTLESVNFNVNNIVDELDSVISQVIADFFGPIEEEVELETPYEKEM